MLVISCLLVWAGFVIGKALVACLSDHEWTGTIILILLLATVATLCYWTTIAGLDEVVPGFDELDQDDFGIIGVLGVALANFAGYIFQLVCNFRLRQKMLRRTS